MPGAKAGSYADMHFMRLDDNLRKIEKALGATDKLAQSITVMNQFKHLS